MPKMIAAFQMPRPARVKSWNICATSGQQDTDKKTGAYDAPKQKNSN